MSLSFLCGSGTSRPAVSYLLIREERQQTICGRRGHAAINHEVMAADVIASRARQEDDCPLEILRDTPVPGRCARDHKLVEVFPV